MAFETWGRPQRMRFDNGRPWSNAQIRVPTALALWLCGLHIELVFGRPRQCTDNAVVERSHGVLNAWVEPQQCADQQVLASRLQKFALIQREEYPACQGPSRQVAFPQLSENSRPYKREQETTLWQLAAVMEYLARFVFTRKVEKNGRITVMTHEYSLGKPYRAQLVTVQLDPARGQWIVKDRDGEILKTFVAEQLNYETIANMKMTYRHFKTQLAGVSNEVYPYDA